MEKNPRVGVGMFVFKDGKFLMGRRMNSHGDGTWSLPGGHLEFNETIEDCTKREVLEEAGVVVKNIRFLDITEDMFKEEDKHYVTIYTVSDYCSGEPRIMEPDKCSEWIWTTWDEMPEPIFLPLINLRKKMKKLDI